MKKFLTTVALLCVCFAAPLCHAQKSNRPAHQSKQVADEFKTALMKKGYTADPYWLDCKVIQVLGEDRILARLTDTRVPAPKGQKAVLVILRLTAGDDIVDGTVLRGSKIKEWGSFPHLRVVGKTQFEANTGGFRTVWEVAPAEARKKD